ncbi:MAG: NAD(+) diphosphatase [Burkholderiaceae bacterium]|nr:NAD(+) diphosphatase [Burkholderiaceae bacterium]
MLQTPAHFIPLITAIVHANPTTLVFRGDELLVRDADLSLASVAVELQPERLHPVGTLGDSYFQVTWVERNTLAASGHSFKKLRSLVGVLDEQLLAIAGRAYQIAEWARTHRYCGVCATETVLLAGERCFKCPACGMSAYPRISPAMMVLIRKGDAILLARHTASPTNRFSALAGFLEAGESIEEAVHREVFEEVRLKIHNLRYFGSQSWPFPHSLMIAYTADYLSGEIAIDLDEIAEARWYGPGDVLPAYAAGYSIAGLLIESHLAAIARK